MRIALVIYGSLDTVSGGYLYDRQMVAFLQSQGDTVDIIGLPWRSYDRHLLDNLSDNLRDRLVHGDYDVILQDELNHPSLFGLNRRLQPNPAPIISVVHHLRSSESHSVWQSAIYRLVERSYLASVDALVFNSRTTAATVEALLNRVVPSLVAYPGRDHGAAPLSAESITVRAAQQPLRVLFVGNIIRRKGLHDLLAALGRIPTSLWVLDIVGNDRIDPAYTAEINRQIDRLPAGARVRRLGGVDDATLENCLAEAHVLAVPSTYEGFGIVYVEGFGHGLVAIGTTSGAAGEVITHDMTGFLVEPGDIDRLAQYLSALAADRDLLADMGRQALGRFTEFPTWTESAGRIRQFLREQIERKASLA